MGNPALFSYEVELRNETQPYQAGQAEEAGFSFIQTPVLYSTLSMRKPCTKRNG
jgi:hypothetical protein